MNQWTQTRTLATDRSPSGSNRLRVQSPTRKAPAEVLSIWVPRWNISPPEGAKVNKINRV